MTFGTVSEPEQLVIDMRNYKEKEAEFQGKNKTTFHRDLDLFKEKPRLMVCEKSKGQIWSSSVHNLGEHATILHIAGCPNDKNKVAFSFYTH